MMMSKNDVQTFCTNQTTHSYNRAKPLPPMERALNSDLERVLSATSHHSSLFYSKEKTAGNRSSGGSFVLALANKWPQKASTKKVMSSNKQAQNGS